jgi:hypothetical protein
MKSASRAFACYLSMQPEAQVMADMMMIFALGFGYGYAVRHWISLQRSFVLW